VGAGSVGAVAGVGVGSVGAVAGTVVDSGACVGRQELANMDELKAIDTTIIVFIAFLTRNFSFIAVYCINSVIPETNNLQP
jgi:hypothetical protein